MTSTLRKRVEHLEERRAFEQFRMTQDEFAGHSTDELEFFAIYGYWPNGVGETLPKRRELIIHGLRVVITAERMGDQ